MQHGRIKEREETMASLLPRQRDDFNSKAYWDKFNAKTSEFEWYGGHKDLESTLQPYLPKDARILMVGCGNSAFSAALYDSGLRNIVNVDFDDSVIAEMQLRNADRKEMKWEVQDMRRLSFADSSFDVVLDKGALDALMSSPSATVDAREMMQSVARVLKPGGRYLCISLAQEFVYTRVAEAIAESYASADVHLMEAASGDSSHVPFLFSACKGVPVAPASQNVRVWFGDDGVRSEASATSADKCWGLLKSAQECFGAKKTKDKLRLLKPGRVERMDLWSTTASEEARTAKYSVTILDGQEGKAFSQPVAAFIVPQGREHEFLFSSEDGLRQILASASCARLLSVTLNRGHVFENLEAVQAELSSTIVALAQEGVAGKIPFMTMAESLGFRDIVARGSLAFGADYMVEETATESGVVRRLVFEANANVIQTEVRLLSGQQGTAGSLRSGARSKCKGKKAGSKKKKGKKKGGSGAAAAAEEDEEGNAEEEGVDGGSCTATVDFGFLCFDYHRAIIAGMAIADALAGRALLEHLDAAVIGLGGGALPMALHHFFPTVKLQVVELDSVVATVASRWFGFKPDASLSVHIGDGLEFGVGATKKYVFIVVDVDSKDTTVGMSCPPEAFLSDSYLGRIKDALADGGVLVLNVAARSPDMYQSALESVCRAFPSSDGRVFFLKASDDDVNTVVFALKGGSSCLPSIDYSTASSGATSKGGKKAKGQGSVQQHGGLRSRVREWLLRVPGQSDDPLGLLDLVGTIEEIPSYSS